MAVFLPPDGYGNTFGGIGMFEDMVKLKVKSVFLVTEQRAPIFPVPKQEGDRINDKVRMETDGRRPAMRLAIKVCVVGQKVEIEFPNHCNTKTQGPLCSYSFDHFRRLLVI